MGLLELVIVLLLVLWITGNLVFPAVGQLLHVLFVIAVILIIVRLFQSRKVL